MAKIVLEQYTQRGGAAQPSGSGVSYYQYQTVLIEFDTVTIDVSTTITDFYVFDEREIEGDLANPYYIDPSRGFYTQVVSPSYAKSYNYQGGGLVDFTEIGEPDADNGDGNGTTGGMCSLRISQILTTPASDGTNGTATVLHTGAVFSTEMLWYSLDNATWQQSNVFTGLGFGPYTAFIQDSVTLCRGTLNFFITEVVTYAPRYYLEFDQHHTGKVCRLEVHTKNYTGTPENLEKGGDITLYKADSGNKYEAVKNTQADIGLLSFTRQKFLHFFTADERENRIDLFLDGQLYYRGYVLPDIYREPFLSAVYTSSVTASDGFNTLKNYPYTDFAGNPYTGEKTLLEILFDCLDKLDLNLPLRTAVDIYEANMVETSDVNDTNPTISDPLFQAVVSTENFKNDKGLPIDCGEVLTRILESFKARIYQDNGIIVVECIDAKRRPYWAVNYKPDRTFKGYETINPLKLTVRPNTGGLQWINGEQQLDMVPAWKKTLLESELQIIENALPGGEMRDSDFNAGELPAGAYNTDTLKGWTSNRQYYRYRVGKGKNAISFNADFPGPHDFFAAQSWRSAPLDLTADGKTTLYITLKFSAQHSPSGIHETVVNPELYYQLRSADSLFKDSKWVPMSSSVAETVPIASGNSVQTYEAITPPIPASGRYWLVVYEASRAGGHANLQQFLLHGAGVQVLPLGVKPSGYNYVEITNPGRFTHAPKPESVYFTDTPFSPNYKQVHRNYITVNGQQSKAWHIKGAPMPAEGQSDPPLISLLASNIAYNYLWNTHTLSGTLLGELSYQDTIKERWDNSRLFILDGMKLNIRFAQYQVTLLELITAQSDPVNQTGPGSGVAVNPYGLLTEDQALYLITEDYQKILVTEESI